SLPPPSAVSAALDRQAAKEPLNGSDTDRIRARKLRMQGVSRSAAVVPRPGDTTQPAGAYGSNPFGAGPLRASGRRHSLLACNEHATLLIPCQPRAKAPVRPRMIHSEVP